MMIVDHLSVGVSDIDTGCNFYDAIMATLGVPRLARTEGFAAYGEGTVQFLIMLPENGQPSQAGNGIHIALVARSQEAVTAFHAAALKAGGTCAGEPGLRPDYPAPNVFAAFVRDPFGNKLEAIHNGFAGLD